ncbi:MAG: hypothetical protein HY067_23240 [Betaproteobacteria bacterium]|nr:hypothetical protein [Betaproteobacteria bacterium]
MTPRRWFGSKYRLGTLRVEKNGTSYAVSGDTYRYSWFDVLLGGGIPSFGPTTIPIYARNRYNSYLKVTAVNIPFISKGACKIHLTVEEYDYTQPAAGSFDGTFPASASRVMDIYLMSIAPPAGFAGPYFTGQVYIGGVLQGNLSVTLAWVSAMFRRATVEVHTMAGSVAPAPVPSGGGSEYFNTIYAKAHWDLTVLTDPNPVPVPTTMPPTVPTACWPSNALHAVMTSLSDFSAVNLDATWHMHVLVVQAQLGCGRGVMFDTINVPREGVASFCEDGYPSSDSAWFGSAANQQQKNVPRAFLRSCTHEITHGFNQIHQEQEGGADNSIMTTTPSVANTIHAASGTFPDDINLDFNSHVRHHLRHLPDPIIRPGGMTFTAGHNGIPVPSEDEADHTTDEVVQHPSLELSLEATKHRVKIGEPLHLTWTMTNSGSDTIQAPNFVGIEHDFAELRVVKSDGSALDVAPFVIVCDASQLSDLKPGETRTAEHHLFWSTQGFSFDAPGKHTVELTVSWNAGDIKVGATDSLEVLVDYPVTERDNDVIAHMMNPEVGKFIALGGHAYHLKEAVSRVGKVVRDHPTHDVGKCMAAFYDDKLATAKRK